MPRPPASTAALPLLNWHHPRHWARAEAPCTHCFGPTYLRDDTGAPSHKVCAEQALHHGRARALARYRQRTI